MKVVICEDSKFFTEHLVDIVNAWAKEREVPTEIATYASAEAFLPDWRKSEDYDIMFFDYQMGPINGLELAKIVRKTNSGIPIVFVTSMQGFSGYSVSAMRVLYKPAKKEDCFACLDQVHQK